MSGLSIIAGGPGNYISWGVIQISVTNALIIGSMILLFILALVIPFPTHDDEPGEQQGQGR
jgi:hypothetical protein